MKFNTLRNMRGIFLFFFMLSSFPLSADSYYELIGKRIVITPTIKDREERVYTIEADNKNSFSNKYLYTYPIAGDTINITNVKHINENNPKKEVVLLYFTHRGHSAIYYIPLYFKDYDYHTYASFFVGGQTGSGGRFVRGQQSIKNLDIVYYDADKINEFIYKYSNKTLYPNEKVIHTWDYELKNAPNPKIFTKNKEYKFKKFEFLTEPTTGGKYQYRGLKTLYAIFSDEEGNEKKIFVAHKSFENDEIHKTIDQLKDAFIIKDNLIETCEKNKDINLIEEIETKFSSKNVSIERSDMTKMVYDNIMDTKTLKNRFYSKCKDFRFSSVKRLKAIRNNEVLFDYFMIVNDCEGNEFAIPVTKSYNLFMKEDK